MDFLSSGHAGLFASEEAEGEELERVMILCHRECQLSTIIYLNLLNPQASKSENMKANKSLFMVFHCVLSLITHFSPNGSVGETKLENNFARISSEKCLDHYLFKWLFLNYSILKNITERIRMIISIIRMLSTILRILFSYSHNI